MREERGPGRWIAALLALGIVVLLGWALRQAQSPPREPVPVAWDRIACARCGMLVGDPAFAAQLHTPEGVLHFDDPGCLLLELGEDGREARAAWFHAHGGERWIPMERVRFRPVPASPMGYGLGAGGGETLPLSMAQALERAREREARRRSDG